MSIPTEAHVDVLVARIASALSRQHEQEHDAAEDALDELATLAVAGIDALNQIHDIAREFRL